MKLDAQRPTPIEPTPAVVSVPPPTAPYLLPTAGGDISVREVHYGGKSLGHELIEAIVLSLLIFLLVQSVVQNRKVVGHSMDPTLQNEEHLLIDRASYFEVDTNFVPRLLGQAGLPDHEAYVFGGPQRGDIIVFRPPVDTEDYIKRVIAVAGEKVEVRAYDGEPNSGGTVISMGRTLPFDIPDVVPEGTNAPVQVNVFLRRVNAFTPPASAAAPSQ